MKAVDDIIGGDIGNGGSRIEESFDVGRQSLPTLLFAQAQVVASSWSMDGALQVVDEELLQVLPRVDRVVF